MIALRTDVYLELTLVALTFLRPYLNSKQITLPLSWETRELRIHTSFPGDHRALVPPDPIPNSVVKRCIADGSVGFPHVRVGHRQDLN